MSESDSLRDPLHAGDAASGARTVVAVSHKALPLRRESAAHGTPTPNALARSAGADAMRVAADDAALAVEKIDNAAGFAALQTEWNELLQASRADGLFLTWEWLYTWWKHLREDRQLEIVTVRRGARLVAIAPLALRPSRMRRLVPFPVLEFLGAGSVGSDYLDVLIHRDDEHAAVTRLAQCLAGHKRMLELAQVGRDARVADLAAALARHGWPSFCRTTDLCPYIDLTGQSWESYLDSLGAAHRYNFRRRLRNLSKQFDVRFERADSEAERREAMRLLIALHRKRWRGRADADAFHEPGLLAFHEELSAAALRRGWLRLYVLRLDGQPAAALYGFNYNRVFYFYQSGFDPDFNKYSVGLVIMGLAIKSAIEEGVALYDFLHGDEQYKFLWARQSRELRRFELYPPSARGAFYRRAMNLRGSIKRWFGAPAAAARITESATARDVA
ncbi:MAG: GNAT family N-acetyltransferase [Sulfurifustis sp.]